MPSPFPPRGLSYFWFLNDECDDAHMDAQIAEFAKGDMGAVCLHPRGGLLLPYGGTDWFDFIRRTATKCADAGLDVWLYDEDPYPSGSAGGRLVAEQPEYTAYQIEMVVDGEVEVDADLEGNEHLFCFPIGKLLWAGLVPADDAPDQPATDMTERVGVVRRHWKVLRGWDSRWYYPATPLYKCDRSEAYVPEYALRRPDVPEGMRLVAFVARPAGGDNPWGGQADSLNPAATQRFIELTHERYKDAVGDMFGKEIKAIFTDEPKYFGGRPWTDAMPADFQKRYGYDIRQRLHHLFSSHDSRSAMETRLHFREWCGERFESAWLKPVADWCHQNDLCLVGHISPEDDPVEQANTISNLFPLLDHFDLAGLDLIIPAVGDARHPIINIGVTVAASVAQQRQKGGVMCEMLGASGLELSQLDARRVVNWQCIMGVTTPAVHAIFSSTRGDRLVDAPPDFGPQSEFWEGFQPLSVELRPVQEIMLTGKQVAPVAILWPIRTFQASSQAWQADDGGRRGTFARLLLRCLERQVGTHILDESGLWKAAIKDGAIVLGDARYEHLVVPPATILHERTYPLLDECERQGIQLICIDEKPSLVIGAELESAPAIPSDVVSIDVAVSRLPRLAEIDCASSDLRCTGWRDSTGRVQLLLNNISTAPLTACLDQTEYELSPGEIVVHGD